MNPVGNKILVKEFPPEELSKGGIIIPQLSRKRVGKAITLMVSPDLIEDEFNHLPKTGDVIAFDPEAGEMVLFNNEECTIITEEDVLAII